MNRQLSHPLCPGLVVQLTYKERARRRPRGLAAAFGDAIAPHPSHWQPRCVLVVLPRSLPRVLTVTTAVSRRGRASRVTAATTNLSPTAAPAAERITTAPPPPPARPPRRRRSCNCLSRLPQPATASADVFRGQTDSARNRRGSNLDGKPHAGRTTGASTQTCLRQDRETQIDLSAIRVVTFNSYACPLG